MKNKYDKTYGLIREMIHIVEELEDDDCLQGFDFGNQTPITSIEELIARLYNWQEYQHLMGERERDDIQN